MRIDPDAYDIAEVIGAYTELVPEGRRYLRSTEHSSLVVDRDTNRFFWNAGGVEVGDVVQYFTSVQGMPIQTALNAVTRLPKSIPAIENRAARKDIEYTRLDYGIAIEHNARLDAGGYRWWLDRGVHRDTVDTLRLGLYKDGKGDTWYTIPIPSYPNRDYLANYKLRRAGHATGKNRYRQLAHDLETVLYVPYPALINKNKLLIVGGEIKAIVLGQYGIPVVSSSSGAPTWDVEWQAAKDKDVTICFDPKEDEIANKVAGRVLLSGANSVRIITLEHDPDDEIVVHGKSPEEIRRTLLGE